MLLSRFATTGGTVQKTYVDDVFSTFLYTGNGSSLAINNGIDLAGKGGMVWIKRRDVGYDTAIQDTARGLNQLLLFNSTAAQLNSGVIPYNGQTSSGFSVGTTAYGNTNGGWYASWTFRKAPRFFDVVTYSGTGATQSISHSLGIQPGLIICKRYSGASASWFIYHKSLGATKFTTSSFSGINTVSSAWNNTEPTDLTFTVGNNQHNTLGENNVAYLFADDPSSDGIIRTGLFTTDTSGNASVSSINWEPQFLLIKEAGNANQDGGWKMFDSIRGWNLTANDAAIKPSMTEAESATTEYGNPTSTGFEFKGGAASATYIYMAIRRSNKPPTSGTEVFNLQASSVNGATITGSVQTSAPNKVDVVIRAFRSGDAKNFEFYDRIRGIPSSSTVSVDSYTTPRLSSSDTSAEVTTGTDVYQRSGSAGFADFVAFMSLTAGTVNYAFKRAPGFFDVVCYTGETTQHATPHNLGVKPDLIIRKRRDSSGFGQWDVGYGADGFWQLSLVLNTAANAANTARFGSGADPHTTTTFTSTETSTGTHVAYLFASLPGISKVGIYTGNGSSQTINCGFSAGARFVLIKRTDSTGDWYVWDTARGISSGNDPHLSLNGTAAEVTTDDSVDVDSSGFVVNQVAATNINVSAATFLYLAIS